MNLETVLASARAAGFSDLDSLRRLARVAVALTPAAGEVAPRPCSRWGGLPRLPPGVDWPRREGQSLAFVAQIDLASLPVGVALERGLPQVGLLLFFYDLDHGAWGFDPADAGSFSVIYAPDPEATVAVSEWPADLPAHARYEAVDLVGDAVVGLPPLDSVLVEDLELTEEQRDAYRTLMQSLNGEERPPRGLIGGHPDQVQGDIMLECALVGAGLYCGDGTAYADPRFSQLRDRARDWRLLLQVPSVEAAGMMWGDMGSLFFCIRNEDLGARSFDRCWMILQCG